MRKNAKESSATPIPEMEPDKTDPCYDCPRAEWYELYGQWVYGCDMSTCIKALEEEKLW